MPMTPRQRVTSRLVALRILNGYERASEASKDSMVSVPTQRKIERTDEPVHNESIRRYSRFLGIEPGELRGLRSGTLQILVELVHESKG